MKVFNPQAVGIWNCEIMKELNRQILLFFAKIRNNDFILNIIFHIEPEYHLKSTFKQKNTLDQNLICRSWEMNFRKFLKNLFIEMTYIYDKYKKKIMLKT